jgi:transketolase
VAGLTAILDCNRVQQSGHVAEMLPMEPIAEKWRAFGWAVREFDGHDMAQIVDALDALPLEPDKPSLLLAHTVKGKGVSFAEDTYLWHHNMITEEIYEKAMAELGEPA